MWQALLSRLVSMLEWTARETVARKRMVVGSVTRALVHYLFVQWAAAQNVVCCLLRVTDMWTHMHLHATPSRYVFRGINSAR